MYRYFFHYWIYSVLVIRNCDSVTFTSSERFVQTIQTFLDNSLNITVFDSTIFSHNIKSLHIALCVSSEACLAVSDTDTNEHIYFSGFGQLPGTSLSTIPLHPLNWTTVQHISDDESTNYALHGETFASTYDVDQPPSLGVDGDRNRNFVAGSCAFAERSSDDIQPWWSVKLQQQV